jgi:hypothetical protein
MNAENVGDKPAATETRDLRLISWPDVLTRLPLGEDDVFQQETVASTETAHASGTPPSHDARD